MKNKLLKNMSLLLALTVTAGSVLTGQTEVKAATDYVVEEDGTLHVNGNIPYDTLPTDGSLCESDDGVTDYNGTPATANILPLSTKIYGLINYDEVTRPNNYVSDQDWYKVIIESDGYFQYTFSTEGNSKRRHDGFAVLTYSSVDLTSPICRTGETGTSTRSKIACRKGDVIYICVESQDKTYTKTTDWGTTVAGDYAATNCLYSVKVNNVAQDLSQVDAMLNTWTDMYGNPIGNTDSGSTGGTGDSSDNSGNQSGESTPAGTVRLGGATRFETATAVADQMKSGAFSSIVLANAYNFPDALAGCTLAKQKNAPILLVSTTEADNAITYQYISANAEAGATIYLLGGTSAVSQTTENTLRANGYNVVRLGGATRYETNMSIVNNTSIASGTPVIIASGNSFADSLAISGIAGAKGYPIFLTNDTISQDALNKIASIAPSNIYIVGGTAAVNGTIEATLRNYGNVTRLSGATRYETALAVAEQFKSLTIGRAFVANGTNFPDALTGSVLAGKFAAPIILVNNNDDVTNQANYLKTSNITSLYVLGGTSAVSEDVVNRLTQ